MGDVLEFQLLLFGKTIVYFSQFVQAVYQLGNVGIGREHSLFEIGVIRNTLGKDILREQGICMDQCRVRADDMGWAVSHGFGGEFPVDDGPPLFQHPGSEDAS